MPDTHLFSVCLNVAVDGTVTDSRKPPCCPRCDGEKQLPIIEQSRWALEPAFHGWETCPTCEGTGVDPNPPEEDEETEAPRGH